MAKTTIDVDVDDKAGKTTVTVTAAAKLLAVTPKTIRNWQDQGCEAIGKRVDMFRLMLWLEQRAMEKGRGQWQGAGSAPELVCTILGESRSALESQGFPYFDGNKPVNLINAVDWYVKNRAEAFHSAMEKREGAQTVISGPIMDVEVAAALLGFATVGNMTAAIAFDGPLLVEGSKTMVHGDRLIAQATRHMVNEAVTSVSADHARVREEAVQAERDAGLERQQAIVSEVRSNDRDMRVHILMGGHSHTTPGERLRMTLAALGYTPAALAKAAGVAYHHVDEALGWSGGVPFEHSATWSLFARTLEVPPAALIGDGDGFPAPVSGYATAARDEDEG